MVAEGADIIDIGAESTRPYGGAVAVSAEEEMRRLEPVLPAVVALGMPVSIDTMKAKVAAWALAAGRRHRQRRLGPAARCRHGARGRRARRAGHRHAQPRRAPIRRSTSSPTSRRSSRARSRSPTRAGIARQQIVLDPGIGFGKTPEQSIIAIARLDELQSFGLPLLVGASRKRFIANVSPAPPDQRLGGSIAAHLAGGRGRRRDRAHP